MATKKAVAKKAVAKKAVVEKVGTTGYLFSDKDLEAFDLEEWMDKPIYRIFPVSRFIQVLETNALTLVKPKKWDDPFENALLSATFMVGNEIATLAAKDSVYGQCWTLHRETDAMWRIYSHDKDGVRVMTTPRKLLTALKRHVGHHADVKCFIGKVQYAPKSHLPAIFANIDLLKTDGTGIAKSLLVKRREFSHEREMRLIYSADDNSSESDIFSFAIEPNEMFDRLLFDPRMDAKVRASHKVQFTKLGCVVDVKRSMLYDPPKGMKFKLG